MPENPTPPTPDGPDARLARLEAKLGALEARLGPEPPMAKAPHPPVDASGDQDGPALSAPTLRPPSVRPQRQGRAGQRVTLQDEAGRG
jgi:hypothetical protein